MSRSYKNVRPKKNWVYSVEDLMELYSVTDNTVSNWVGEGLMPSDSQRPNLFQGASVIRFHQQKRKQTSFILAASEFYCLTCKIPIKPSTEMMTFDTASNGKHMCCATCPRCSRKVQKFVSETDRDNFENCRNPNTTTECQHEEDSTVRGGVGSSSEINTSDLCVRNDRIIYKWLSYAGRYDVKTIDRHLAAIRYGEALLQGKPFQTLTTDDVAKVRDDLKRRAKWDATDHLSSSSIKHTVSHLIAFSEWLLKQDGFKRLPKDITGYLKLPKATVAASTAMDSKDFPTIEEAEDLLKQMPSKSLGDQRARAIFAIAFLGALRADTIASLKIKHFDIGNKLILQDASTVRAKAGKHINIRWFPIQKTFADIVIDWVQKLRSLGFTGDDSLFLDLKFLKHRPALGSPQAVPVMSTSHVVTQAFAIASQNSDVKYTPHAAKHTIGAEKDMRPLTQLERKAWSVNMGHENEQTTERHYGKLADEQRFEVLGNIGKNELTKNANISDEVKIAIFDSFFRQLKLLRTP
ncbi:Site-specific recombinase XerC [Yoonia tamlensis]|uniref:Site-specific recombinase XerC n=1 Tax=Yoonia tamlensis TaxID=390270 RepID=A0A1I6G961_9RHOB|nr:site-specific integrase [Yoonia tamlensis]SFR38709.1 Site-specific recombinase XerC [Yoonia tamlensis]